MVGAMLAACVMVPTAKPYYDQDCHVASKQFELEPVMLDHMHHCHGDECAAFLVLSGAVAAASVVISGSIHGARQRGVLDGTPRALQTGLIVGVEL